jgi:hypothetical protein
VKESSFINFIAFGKGIVNNKIIKKRASKQVFNLRNREGRARKYCMKKEGGKKEDSIFEWLLK